MNDLPEVMRWCCLAILASAGSGCHCNVLAGIEPGPGSSSDAGCTPTSCTTQGANCGAVADGCGGTLHCGVCAEGLVCGGSGVASVCAPHCTGGWCWQHPLPQGNALSDVWRSPAGELWVVGPEGTLLRHDGEQWHRMPAPSSRELRSVWGTAEDDVWLGGAGAWHWDGARWSQVPLPSGFLGVVGVIRGSSASDVWALNGQSIFHWDGHVWAESTKGTTSLNALWVNTPNDVWAVGDFGVVLRWNGAQWSSMSGLGAGEHARGVSGTSAADVWVVGFQVDSAGKGTSLVEHWDGTKWTAAWTPAWPITNTTEYRSVLALGATDVWAVGDEGTVIQWDGIQWRNVPTGTEAWLTQLAGVDRDHVWVVGNGGTLLEWTRGAWRFLGGNENSRLSALWGASPTDAWTVGTDGFAAHWDGTTWTPAVGLNEPRPDRGTPGTLPGLAHYALWGSGHDDVWCADSVGNAAQLQHFDGVSWLPGKLGAPNSMPFFFRAGCSLSPTDSWTVGSTVFRLPGGSWTELTGSWPWFTDVSCEGPTDVWAVGSTNASPPVGQVFHWDGAAFSTAYVAPSGTLSHVWAASSTDVWVTGASPEGVGHILHWNGTAWSEADWMGAVASSELNDRNAELTSITGHGKDVWVSTNVGFLLHWDGQRWSRIDTGDYGFVSAIWRAQTGELWIAGYDGAILHHD